MVIEFIELLISFIIIWVLGFILHEICHLLECIRQAGKGKIEVWFNNNIPSMRCVCDTYMNYTLFKFAGGFLSGCLLLLIGAITLGYIPVIGIPLILVGLVNFVYGFYEAAFLSNIPFKDYMKWHYVLYGITLTLGIILLRNHIIDFIN